MIRKNGVVSLIGLALVAVISLSGCSMKLGGGSSDSSPSASPSASATPSSTPKVKAASDMTKTERDALIKALTVSTVSASAECKTDGQTSDGRGYVTYAIDSLLGTPPRLWPASLSTAITATDPVGARTQLQQAICKDPLLGTAWLTFVATTVRDEVLATTGMDLLVLNPRLKAYTDVSQIKAEAKAFVPLLNVKSPTASQLDGAVTKNVNWQQDAALVNTLLERFAATGIEARQSLVNYELFNYINATDLSDVRVAKDQENLPALIFAITVKGQCGEVMAFGANTGDKRPELFAAKTCAPPVTTTKPGCTTHCGTGTHKCTTNCGGHPSCTTNCGNTPKNPSKDVGANPNVDPFLQNGGEKETVSNGNGASVSNGNQGSAADVAAAQKAAAAKAAADAAAAKAAQDAANQAANQSGGGQVSDNQNQGNSGNPNW